MSPSIHSIHSIQEVIKAYQSHFVPEIEVYSQLYEDSKLRTGVALVKSSGTRYDGTSSFHMWIDPRFHGSPVENIGRSMGDPWEIHGCWIPFEGQRFGKDSAKMARWSWAMTLFKCALTVFFSRSCLCILPSLE